MARLTAASSKPKSFSTAATLPTASRRPKLRRMAWRGGAFSNADSSGTDLRGACSDSRFERTQCVNERGWLRQKRGVATVDLGDDDAAAARREEALPLGRQRPIVAHHN